MFDKAVKGLAKKAALEKGGNGLNEQKKPDLGPIVNYETVYWRKDPTTEARRTEKKPTASDSKDVNHSRVENWAAKT